MLRFRTPALPLTHPASVIATWFGSGLVPKAGGTAGSLATLPFAWVIHGFAGGHGVFLFSVVTFFVGWWATHRYMQAGGNHDPNEVVIDEVSGQSLLLAFMPQAVWAYVLGFFLFRLFDIWKPWPVRVADQRVHSALGVMLDDTLAAIYPLVIALAVYYVALFLGVEFVGVR